MPPGPERAEVLLETVRVQRTGAADRIALLEQALQEAGADDVRAAQILGLLSINRWQSGELARGLHDARAGLRRAERAGDPRMLAAAMSYVGFLETWVLEITPGLLERGVDLERGLSEPLTFHDSPTFALAVRCLQHDRLDVARALLEELGATAEAHGDEHTRGFCLLELMHVEWYAGRLDRAMHYAEATRDLAEQIAAPQLRLLALSFGALVLTDHGRTEEARATITEGLALATAMDDLASRGILSEALGRLALVRGELQSAHAALDGLPELLLRQGHLHPGTGPWGDAIEVLVGLGELDRAEVMVRQFESLAARSSRWARAVAARSRGLLLLAKGDTERAVAALERSLAGEAGTYPLERGRTLLVLGTTHRLARRSRVAREVLERAVEVFGDIGAEPWRDRAVAELARVSGRRRGGAGLTQAELSVAELAAAGRKNKEIAATLFLGVSTVEMHLSRVYRKLGLRSRTELAARLAEWRDDGANV
jgi:ATP/maltotriose-dependent transcriptional regulator MalT